MIDHCRRDRNVVRHAIGLGVPSLDLTVPERYRQSWRSILAGLISVHRHVPEEAEVVAGSQMLVSLDAPLIGRLHARPVCNDVVVAYVGARPRCRATVRRHLLTEG